MVSDPAKSADFYQKVLGWRVVEQKEDYAYLVPDNKEYPATNFMLVVGKAREGSIGGDLFNRNRIGLDHFAFNIEGLNKLKEKEKLLKRLGVEMEGGGITDDDFGGTAIFCYDPDGMKVEFHLS